jgi:hypothetical protein
MKKITLLAILAIAAFSNNVNAQATATATATATIVTPIAIAKTVDMSFGNIAVTGTGGTVVLSPDDTSTRTKTGGVTLPQSAGLVSAASFDVTGTAGYVYSITIPTSLTLTHTDNTTTMTVTVIENNIGEAGTLDATTGKQNILVGGTLNVLASQLAGIYSNTADLTVTVNYN